MIRKAVFDDLGSINEIYNQAIKQKYQTADTSPISMEKRKIWYLNHDTEKYPVFVHVQANQIIGWISLSAYREGRKALETVAEVSYFVHRDFQGKGVGNLLLKTAISKSKEYGFRNLIAILLEPNTRSIKLLEKFNFERWGCMPKIALIDGKEHDHLFYGLRL